jgi:hypothetical protein
VVGCKTWHLTLEKRNWIKDVLMKCLGEYLELGKMDDRFGNFKNEEFDI